MNILMQRITLCCLIFIIAYCYGLANDVGKIKQVKQSGDFYWGYGISENYAEARDIALGELTSQIAVRVSSDFEQKIVEKDLDYSSTVKSIIRTHATATLRNVESITQTTYDNHVKVFCYLHKSLVTQIFDERKQLIADMVRKADQYSDELNISSSLKLYNFASILLNSLPGQSVIYEKVNYTTMIPTRVNEILSKIDAFVLVDTLISDKERAITIGLTYNNEPIGSLDIAFWDGSNQVAVRARDGYATFHLFGASVRFDKVHARIKYAYYESRKEYNIIEQLWSLVIHPEYINDLDIAFIDGNDRVSQLHESQHKAEQNSVNYVDLIDSAAIPIAQIQSETRQFLSILVDTNSINIRDIYKNDQFLFNKIRRYKDHNRPTPSYIDIEPSIQHTVSGWELRRIRVLHRYPSIKKESTEYLVLDFSEDGRLIDFNTCITEELYNKFVRNSRVSNDWQNRQEIVKFLEKYRTAYLTRDTRIIELMFADSALIIVGRVIKTTELPKDMLRYERLGDQPDVEYLRLSKSDYIKRLHLIFSSQQDIFLDFPSFNIIQKNNIENIYGIEMRQNYTSTSYADEGYLFLLIDFNMPDPLIYVRAWQPNTWNEDELITTANWKIYR